MGLLLGACVVLAGMSLISAAVLPRQGRVSRIVGTWRKRFLGVQHAFAFSRSQEPISISQGNGIAG